MQCQEHIFFPQIFFPPLRRANSNDSSGQLAREIERVILEEDCPDGPEGLVILSNHTDARLSSWTPVSTHTFDVSVVYVTEHYVVEYSARDED